MNEGTCGTCRYWAPSRWPDRKPIAYEYSECRRHAPAHAHAPTVWPVTQADGWCGEYAARASETGSEARCGRCGVLVTGGCDERGCPMHGATVPASVGHPVCQSCGAFVDSRGKCRISEHNA